MSSNKVDKSTNPALNKADVIRRPFDAEIDNGTDRRTQNDILVLLDIDHDGMIVAQKEY